METLSIINFLEQAKHGVIIDVRSPSEYQKGHIPGAQNIPLFDDAERAKIGTLYKQVSKDKAVEVGLEIVGPKMIKFVKKAKKLSQGKKIFIYCWRGGMRSGSMGWLFETAGMSVAKLHHGYKGYRRYIIDSFSALEGRIVVLAGYTGSGKTEILHELTKLGEQVLDLEGIANHRGSVFGGFGKGTQPSSEHFCNLVHQRLEELTDDKIIWCESESISIGHVFMINELFQVLSASPIVNIDIPSSIRVKRLVDDYGHFEKEMYLNAFDKIRKRLGNDRADLAKQHVEQGELDKAVEIALHYYDKGYTKSTEQRTAGFICSVESDSGDPRTNAERVLAAYNSLK